MAKRDNVRNLLREGEDQPLVRGRGVAGMFTDNPTIQQADLTTNRHNDLSANRHNDLSASRHDDLSASRHDDNPTIQQADLTTKYIPAPFRLPAPMVKAMRVLAAQSDRSQQDLWEEAGRDLLAKYEQPVD